MNWTTRTLAALTAWVAATTAAAQPTLPEVDLLSLDEATQGQIKYAEGTVRASLGPDGQALFGAAPDELVRPCVEGSFERAQVCARFYMARGGEGLPDVVVVVGRAQHRETGRRGEVGIACIGRGEAPADAAAQATRIWPDAARVRGVTDLLEDREAVRRCIEAAATEKPTDEGRRPR